MTTRPLPGNWITINGHRKRFGCDICDTNTSEHDHSLSCLSDSQFEQLRKYSGVAIKTSYRVCCNPFEVSSASSPSPSSSESSESSVSSFSLSQASSQAGETNRLNFELASLRAELVASKESEARLLRVNGDLQQNIDETNVLLDETMHNAMWKLFGPPCSDPRFWLGVADIHHLHRSVESYLTPVEPPTS